MYDLGRDSKDDPFKILKQEMIAGELVNSQTNTILLEELKEWLKANTFLEPGEIERVVKEVQLFFIFHQTGLMAWQFYYVRESDDSVLVDSICSLTRNIVEGFPR